MPSKLKINISAFKAKAMKAADDALLRYAKEEENRLGAQSL